MKFSISAIAYLLFAISNQRAHAGNLRSKRVAITEDDKYLHLEAFSTENHTYDNQLDVYLAAQENGHDLHLEEMSPSDGAEDDQDPTPTDGRELSFWPNGCNNKHHGGLPIGQGLPEDDQVWSTDQLRHDHEGRRQRHEYIW